MTLIKVRGVVACNGRVPIRLDEACNGLIEANRDTAVASNDATTFHAFRSSLLQQQRPHCTTNDSYHLAHTRPLR
ncbi:hypothetical protein N9V86_03480 [Opitutales bacterium]|nr:hypothetical protein [Opitutales bacterium]